MMHTAYVSAYGPRYLELLHPHHGVPCSDLKRLGLESVNAHNYMFRDSYGSVAGLAFRWAFLAAAVLLLHRVRGAAPRCMIVHSREIVLIGAVS